MANHQYQYRWNIAYNTSKGVRLYCQSAMSESVAEKFLEIFKAKYLNPDGSPRAYPNGKGHYDIANPELVRVGLARLG